MCIKASSPTYRLATILGILENGQGGSLATGARADICVFDPEQFWELNPDTMVSNGHNSPFFGWQLKGRVTWTLLAGKITYGNNSHDH